MEIHKKYYILHRIFLFPIYMIGIWIIGIFNPKNMANLLKGWSEAINKIHGV